MLFSAIEEPEVVDIVVHRGNSWQRTIELEDEDPATGAFTPTDLTAYTAVGQILDPETDVVLADFLAPELKADGRIPLTLRRADSITLEIGSKVWGLTLVSKEHPDTDTTTIIIGEVRVRKRRYIVSDGAS